MAAFVPTSLGQALEVRPCTAAAPTPASWQRRHRSHAGSITTWAPVGAAVLVCLRRNSTVFPKRRGRQAVVVAAGGASDVLLLDEDELPQVPDLPKGTPVKVVADDITFWHVPGSKGKPFNPQGLEGNVVSVIQDEHLTANRPILVKLTKAPGVEEGFKAFPAHFSLDEILVMDEAAQSQEKVATEESTPPTSAGEGDDSTMLQHLKDDRWVINLLYDGECPSCMKQVEFLQKRMDENPEYEGLVALTDLHAPDYDPELCGGVVFEDGMRHIHAVTRDGEVIAGMDVFRRIYSIVGMQWVYEITTLPVVGAFFDWLYDWFSEYRLKAAGREDILEKVHNHQAKIQELSQTECEDECEVDWDELTMPKFSKMSTGR